MLTQAQWNEIKEKIQALLPEEPESGIKYEVGFHRVVRNDLQAHRRAFSPIWLVAGNECDRISFEGELVFTGGTEDRRNEVLQAAYPIPSQARVTDLVVMLVQYKDPPEIAIGINRFLREIEIKLAFVAKVDGELREYEPNDVFNDTLILETEISC